MTPTPGLDAYPGSCITERVFGHTPNYRIRGLKRKGPPRQMISIRLGDTYAKLNYTVTETDYIPPLYHLTGYLAYNPIEST